MDDFSDWPDTPMHNLINSCNLAALWAIDFYTLTEDEQHHWFDRKQQLMHPESTQSVAPSFAGEEHS